ncbi:MAG: CPBP family intramembrane glutamic endopeptidase [Candidatus Acidiferrales bacterium]
MNFDNDDSPPPDPERAPVPWEIIESQPQAEHSSAGPAIIPSEDLGPARAPLAEDLRVPWGWTELLLVVAVYIGAYLVLLRPVANAFYLFGVSRSQLLKSPNVEGLFLIVHQVVVSVAVLAYLAAQMRLWYGAPFWRTIGWRPLAQRSESRHRAYLGIVTGGFFFSLLIQFTSAQFGTKAKLPIEAIFQNQRNAILFMIMAVAVAPVFEETIFRGYIYPVLARSFGVGASILITGSLFGLLHAQQLWGGWVQIGLMIVVGIALTLVRAVARTVVASYLLHLTYNSVPLIFYIIASHGFHQIPTG